MRTISYSAEGEKNQKGIIDLGIFNIFFLFVFSFHFDCLSTFAFCLPFLCAFQSSRRVCL